MTGYEFAKKVTALLGYSLDDDYSTERKERFLHIFNQVAEDLKLSPINGLTDSVNTESKETEALMYGCAMMLAVSENDAGHAQTFARIYGPKRTALLSHIDSKQDVLPRAENGGG